MVRHVPDDGCGKVILAKQAESDAIARDVRRFKRAGGKIERIKPMTREQLHERIQGDVFGKKRRDIVIKGR